jgi:hypothetical protein
MKQFIHFQFEPQQVASLQREALLAAFDTHKMSDLGLRHYCGSVVIQFNHPDDAPHPVLNPELRKFLRALARRWGPHSAPFFCDVEGPFLLLYFVALLEHLCVAESAGGGDLLVWHRTDELAALRRTALVGIEQLGCRAGLRAGEIRERQRKVAKLLSTAFIHPTHGP